jgi:hypothetical protein
MSLLAGGLTKILGSSLLVPGLFLGLIILAHQLVQARDERHVAQGYQTCTAEWTAETFKQQRNAANKQLAAAREIMEGDRAITEGLRHELESTRTEFAALQAKSDADAVQLADLGGKCLSDGVLDALRKRHGLGAAAKGAGS